MSIKMRNNNSEDAFCCECCATHDKVLNMFDLHIGGMTFTICDECNEKVFYKCLKADCMKNERIKSKKDIAIIQKRNAMKGLKKQ